MYFRFGGRHLWYATSAYEVRSITLSDFENMGIAIGNFLPSCLQAEMSVYFQIIGRHIRFTTSSYIERLDIMQNVLPASDNMVIAFETVLLSCQISVWCFILFDKCTPG